jgi:hypothetical protein
MYFDAAPPLRPGVRYVLEFRGRVVLENGESFDANAEVTFYIDHAGGAPVLASVSPSDGGVIGTATPLVLSFSAPIDPNSFAREFDLQPSAETVISWDAPGQQVTVTPRDAWASLTTYTWKITRDLAAPDGTPTDVEHTGRFRIQLDSTSPTVVSVVPALRSTLAPTGNPLSDTGTDDALLISFSEDVNEESLASAFTLSPPTKGTLLRVSPGVFAFTPDARFVMDQTYTLHVGPSVADLSGNKLGIAFETTFIPAIPVQVVQSIEAVYASSSDTWNVFNTLDAKPITVDVAGKLTLNITFAEPFAVDSQVHMLSGILFEGYFPSSLSDPSLESVSWSGGRVVTLTYAGMTKSTLVTGNYYKLTLPGGAAASDNGSGSFLKDDVWLYFLANQ